MRAVAGQVEDRDVCGTQLGTIPHLGHYAVTLLQNEPVPFGFHIGALADDFPDLLGLRIQLDLNGNEAELDLDQALRIVVAELRDEQPLPGAEEGLAHHLGLVGFGLSAGRAPG